MRKLTSLYEAIRSRNPHGLPYKEAVQLFLWTFCTTDFLPENLKREPLGKERLIEIFEALTADGFVLQLPTADIETPHGSGVIVEWAGLIGAFLSEKIQLDEDFLERVHKYI